MILTAALGGLCIGLAATGLYLSIGRIAGISGIAGQWLSSPLNVSWPLTFVIGLGLGGWLAIQATGGISTLSSQLAGPDLPTHWYLGAGLLVGVGTRLGSGCTSGHGVCGIARLSKRSIVATATFMITGVLTATLVHGL